MGQVSANHTLCRREVVKALLADRKDVLVVTGLGSASYDVMAAGDNDLNYYLWAAMGSAITVGLGLANAQPDKSVVVVTGDGELLMGFGALATVALQKPANLTIAVLDNGHFGETGMQVSHAGFGISLDQVAKTCGFSWTDEIRGMEGVHDLRERFCDPRWRQARDDQDQSRKPATGAASARWSLRQESLSCCLGFQPDLIALCPDPVTQGRCRA